jgi:hypothetical protein
MVPEDQLPPPEDPLPDLLARERELAREGEGERLASLLRTLSVPPQTVLRRRRHTDIR